MAFIVNGSRLRVSVVSKVSQVAAAFNGTAKLSLRELSTERKPKGTSLTKNEDDIIKSVYISQSNNIFVNLAIEDWLYRNTDFNKHHVLLVWRNSPCVVVGRHQNPWLESNMGFLAQNKIDIARRNSGGGTVYHDKGNLNLTFFTPRERYNRKDNLKIITRALDREWGLDVTISEKDDLLLDSQKISGTASKLGRPNAYHHCTLLVNAEKSNMKESLTRNGDEIETNATRSIPSHVKNLTESNREITFERLLNAIGWEYLRTTPLTLKDGGRKLISKQRGFQLINPTDLWFPVQTAQLLDWNELSPDHDCIFVLNSGLNNIRDEYLSWDWRFGKTPKFTVSRTFPVVHESSGKEGPSNVKVTLRVDKGIITDVFFDFPGDKTESLAPTTSLLSSLQGKKYSSQTFDLVERSLLIVEKEEMMKTAAMRA